MPDGNLAELWFHQMQVEHYERARFRVTDNAGECFVDLLSYQRNGKCDCWEFIRKHGIKARIEEALANGTFVPHDRYRCPHIMAARWDILDMFLLSLDKQFPDNDAGI